MVDKVRFCHLVMEVHKLEGVVMRVDICSFFENYVQIPTAHKLIVHTTDGISYKSAEKKMVADLRLPRYVWLLAFMDTNLSNNIRNSWG